MHEKTCYLTDFESHFLYKIKKKNNVFAYLPYPAFSCIPDKEIRDFHMG